MCAISQTPSHTHTHTASPKTKHSINKTGYAILPASHTKHRKKLATTKKKPSGTQTHTHTRWSEKNEDEITHSQRMRMNDPCNLNAEEHCCLSNLALVFIPFLVDYAVSVHVDVVLIFIFSLLHNVISNYNHREFCERFTHKLSKHNWRPERHCSHTPSVIELSRSSPLIMMMVWNLERMRPNWLE